MIFSIYWVYCLLDTSCQAEDGDIQILQTVNKFKLRPTENKNPKYSI